MRTETIQKILFLNDGKKVLDQEHQKLSPYEIIELIALLEEKDEYVRVNLWEYILENSLNQKKISEPDFFNLCRKIENDPLMWQVGLLKNRFAMSSHIFLAYHYSKGDEKVKKLVLDKLFEKFSKYAQGPDDAAREAWTAYTFLLSTNMGLDDSLVEEIFTELLERIKKIKQVSFSASTSSTQK